MIVLGFEWDQKKEKANLKKHGVSFETARTAFYDENAILFYVVCHCFRESETIIRIISARKADKDEEQAYWKQRE